MIALAGLATGAAVLIAAAAVIGIEFRSPRRPRSGRMSPLDQWLAQAGAELSGHQFVAGSAALGVMTLVVVYAVTDTIAVAIVPGVIASMAPRTWFARRRAARLRAVVESWPDGLRELIASVSAGRSLPQALVALADTGPPALRTALGRFEVRSRLVGVVPALEQVKAELGDPTSDRVIEVLILAHTQGGRMVVDVLRDLADAATAEVRTAEQVITESLEQRLNARVVFVLPWLALLVLTARPGPFRDYYQSAAGAGVAAIGGLLSLAGIAIVTRLGREPVEARVLVADEGQP